MNVKRKTSWGAMFMALLMLLHAAMLTGCGNAAAEPKVPTATDGQTKTDLPVKEEQTGTDLPEEVPPQENDRGLSVIEGPDSLARLSKNAKSTVMTVSSVPNDRLFDAFGCEWDPHFFRSFNADSGCTEEAWELIVSRVRELGVKKVRVWVLPDWYEPENDNDDPNEIDPEGFRFDTEDFLSLLRYLDVCETEGIRVTLTVWGVPTLSMEWLGVPYESCGNWVSAPTDKDEFAENVSALLGYLMNTKGYTCLDELILFNEPDLAYTGEGGVIDFNDYAALWRKVNERLTRDGLRDRIRLILSDDTDTSGSDTVSRNGWFAKCLTELSDIADGFDTHVYAFQFNDASAAMVDWAKARNALLDELAPGKQYTHDEFGSNRQVGAYEQTDIDTFERGVFLSQMAAATLNAGSQGMLYWVLHDVRYNGSPIDSHNSLMRLGLFRYADEDWSVRPIYHAWGLIMKHTVPGSEIYPVPVSGSRSAAALKSPDGKWTYLCVNPIWGETVITLENDALRNAEFDVYLYSRDTLPKGDRLPESLGTAWTYQGKTYVYLPSRSFAVLVEK